MGLRAGLVVALLACSSSTGCGARSDTLDPAPSIDGGLDTSAGRRDAAGPLDAGRDARSCGVTWELVEVPTLRIAPLDPGPLNSRRIARFSITHDINLCELPAMPLFAETLEGNNLVVTPRVFRPIGTDCPPGSRTIVRPITYTLGRPGTWHVSAGDVFVEVTVEPPPTRACRPGTAFDCEMDCDCDAGRACLSGYGLAGLFTQCALPCERDRDCRGEGTCQSPDDGLEWACGYGSECFGADDCEEGFACEAGVCTPTFSLGVTTRRECACDTDCDAPMHCLESQRPDRVRRCELLCPTGGAWCQGPHFCGTVHQDIAGLAPADSVCVFVGE